MASIVGDSVILANLIDGLVNGRRINKPKQKRKKKPRRLGGAGLLAHHKDWTVNQAFTATTRSSIVSEYLYIERGDNDEERIGRAVKVRRFIFNGFVDAATSNYIRIDIMLDTQPSSTVEPTLAEIYETEIDPQNEIATALPNPHFNQRFKLLKAVTKVTSPVEQLVPLVIDLPCNFTATYESDSNKVVTNNLLWVFRACDEKYQISGTVRVVGSIRVIFDD